MPCYSCGARQCDPERGPSPWKRGVVREHLVLVCPACQGRAGWSAELQSCPRCGSLHLIRRLDQVECLDCRLVRDAQPDAVGGGEHGGNAHDGSAHDASAAADALADEVASALERVLRRR
jgi:hypothetical protein